MAKEIGGQREPGENGQANYGGQINTPMCSENTGRKNTPSILTYKSTMNTGEKSSGSSSIVGPGKKGEL
jgi:hypothetical protein